MTSRLTGFLRVISAALIVSLFCADSRAVDFEREVAPILIKRCVECHHSIDKSGGLDLTNEAGLKAGGDSGAVISLDRPADSHLLQRVTSGEMPPPKQGKSRKLTDSEIKVLREWLDAKAAWPAGRTLDQFERTTEVRGGRDWWSLQPVRRIDPPAVTTSKRVANPIDNFVLQKLEQRGLEFAPQADRRTLIRRLSYDLTGLPPTYEQTEAFVKDESPKAYEHLVDRLLDSPHYGEKWARYWLDVARFAETSGYERDQEKPGIWKYRDWLVNAFNSDMPFDRFVTEQLAGDEIPNRTEQSAIATGFLAGGTWNDEPNDSEEYLYDRLEDLVHVSTTAFLSLTVKCARCHDHKFDPVSQTDYYRVANAFWAGPVAMRDRKLLGGPSKEELGFDVFGWTDLSREPKPLHLLKKGDPKHKGPLVEPAQLSVVPALARPVASSAADAKTTTRRLQLAQWMVDPQNPLTSRVFVNRVWQQHFGRGLVRSPDNFGFTGDKPTHPELLDWLASEFVRSGWRMKSLHKLMLMSHTWQQSSIHPQQEKYADLDAENRLWWHAERRRLDAEALRDSFLSASAQLDPKLGGPSFKPTISDEALEGLSTKQKAWQASPPNEQRRRSLYIYTKRGLLSPLMTAFDSPDTTLPCGQRDVSTVAPQALALLNNSFAHLHAEALAQRVQTATTSPSEQVRLAWQYALGRRATDSEFAASVEHLARQVRHFEGSPANTDSLATLNVPVTSGLVLSLRADQNVTADAAGRVSQWGNRASGEHFATQTEVTQQPLIIKDAINKQPAIRFNGQRQFLKLAGKLLQAQSHSIAAVVTDRGQPGHREIISNWSGRDGNAGTSVFLGLTNDATVRMSDSFVVSSPVPNRTQPFLLMAVSGASDATVFVNDSLLAKRGGPLNDRRLDTPWVIGQQGNIDGEYWTGDVAELLVFNRELTEPERRQLWSYLRDRYGLKGEQKLAESPAFRALASLCLVLMNSNEFVYVD